MKATAERVIAAYRQWLTEDQEESVEAAFFDHDEGDQLGLLHALDEAVGNHGVEFVVPEKYSANCQPAPKNRRLHYSNAGDSYATTVCWLESNSGLTLSTYGDYVESW